MSLDSDGDIVEKGEVVVSSAEVVWKVMEEMDIREIVEAVPKLDDWGELDGLGKMGRMQELLDHELWAIFAARGDHRTQPNEKDQTRTNYHNLIMPWLEEVCEFCGAGEFEKRMGMGEMDEMVVEMFQAYESEESGKVRSKPSGKIGYLELGSSTGGAQSLDDYYEGIRYKGELQELLKGEDWGVVKTGLENEIGKQDEELLSVYGLSEENVRVVRTQSGTETELLLSLWGVEAMMFTDETGSGTEKVARGEYPSSLSWLGEKGLEGKIEGVEFSSPFKVEMRKDGEIKRAGEVKSETEEWIKKEREEGRGRLAVHVTLGAKTGIGADGESGLLVMDAIELCNQYGGSDGGELMIVADVAQNRITPAEIRMLVDKNILVNITGSKYPGGAMFSHAMLVPSDLAGVLQKRANEDGFVVAEGLRDFVTKSDISTILPEDKLGGLHDLPDVISALKWQAPIETMREYFSEFGLRNVGHSETVVDDLATEFWVSVSEACKLISSESDKEWKVVALDLRKYVLRAGIDALSSFYITMDGQRLTTDEMKKFHQLMSECKGECPAVHLGQAVQVRKGGRREPESILRFAPSMKIITNLIKGLKVENGWGLEYRDELLMSVQQSMMRVMREWG